MTTKTYNIEKIVDSIHNLELHIERMTQSQAFMQKKIEELTDLICKTIDHFNEQEKKLWDLSLLDEKYQKLKSSYSDLNDRLSSIEKSRLVESSWKSFFINNWFKVIAIFGIGGSSVEILKTLKL